MNADNLPPVPPDLPEPPPLPTPTDGATARALGEFLAGDMTEILRRVDGVQTRPEAQPITLVFAGRWLRSPSVRADTDLDATRVHVDCAENPEYWLDVTIPTATLLELLERAAAQHPYASATLLSMLHSVKGLFKKL